MKTKDMIMLILSILGLIFSTAGLVIIIIGMGQRIPVLAGCTTIMGGLTLVALANVLRY
jgi:hypothetical protein